CVRVAENAPDLLGQTDAVGHRRLGGDDRGWVDGVELAGAQQVAAAEYAPARPLALRQTVAAETRPGRRQHHLMSRLALRELHAVTVVEDVRRRLVRVERRPPRTDQPPLHSPDLPLSLCTHRRSSQSSSRATGLAGAPLSHVTTARCSGPSMGPGRM